MKIIYLFFFVKYINGKTSIFFDKQCINKNEFPEKTISIDRIETRRIVLPKKDLYG